MENTTNQENLSYDPNRLLQSLMTRMKLRNYADLSRKLEVPHPIISKVRHRKIPVAASLLIRMHEVSELSIAELRALMGDRRGKYRISDKQFKPQAAAKPERPLHLAARADWHAPITNTGRMDADRHESDSYSSYKMAAKA